jgi:hypothetical protein
LVNLIIRWTFIYLKETEVSARQIAQSMHEYNIERRLHKMLSHNNYVMHKISSFIQHSRPASHQYRFRYRFAIKSYWLLNNSYTTLSLAWPNMPFTRPDTRDRPTLARVTGGRHAGPAPTVIATIQHPGYQSRGRTMA